MHCVSVEVARGMDGVIILETSLRITSSWSENPVFWVNLLAWASAPAGAEGGGEFRVVDRAEAGALQPPSPRGAGQARRW